MSNALVILMAQINPTVGAIEANAEKIIQIIQTHQATHDLIVFPELALVGYPPEDLLLRPELTQRVEQALAAICLATENTPTHVALGHPHQENNQHFNSLSMLHRGQIIAHYNKHHLPNTGVFDEKRYFTPGSNTSCVLNINNHLIGFCICEDIWQPGPVEQALEAGAELLVCLNASPFEIHKAEKRLELLKAHAKKGLSLIYVNIVGGQDELVFDGRSFALDNQGKIQAQAPAFAEHLQTVHVQNHKIQSEIAPALEENALIYQALCTGVREYINKNGFPGVVLGLSGGLDSALTLAIAVDALGADRVHALALPSRYTSDISTVDINQILALQGVSHHTLSIEPGFETMLKTLEPIFDEQGAPEITQQNLQARLRGLLLMAYSNSHGMLVLTTSNKSESAVGYTTLYGDMCGGFAPIKDVPKTRAYALAHYRNSLGRVIPERVLTRAPSAELADNQTDQDSLPDYPELDAIIAYHMDEKLSAADIINKGHTPDVVHHVINLIKRNEYKRRQAAPGTKITSRAFGRDWRYPITSGF
jgi:NAD+ synthase (glutamine-hydrolysing)|tara:strand:- start:9001 stop:10608 length:1608 start_codon:yes stop_codon:yes gene_type:complete